MGHEPSRGLQSARPFTDEQPSHARSATPISNTLTGNQAIVQAARRSGCDFLATPATAMTAPMLDDFPRTAGHADGRASQTTDAPEAIRRCLEVAATGATPLAATAGPTLTACGELIGQAQWAQLPIVIVHCQHLGPTPLAATSSQRAAGVAPRGAADHSAIPAGDTDVTRARHLTPGSIPLPVLAATDAASAYQLTHRAFDIAQRLRTPVILLTSKDIALTPQHVDPDKLDRTTTKGATDGPPARVEVAPADPDAWPRDPARLEAKLTSLQNKITHNQDFLELTLPDPDPDAETLLISYGLADQAARKAVTLIRAAAARVSHLTLYSLWPIPGRAIRRALTPYVHRVLIPELNTGLYAAELVGIIKAVKIEPLPRFDGRLIDPQTIARQVTHWPCG
ncbi:MAG: hypothetical protein V3U44_03565 [Alphaproteobacteria bacterium]